MVGDFSKTSLVCPAEDIVQKAAILPKLCILDLDKTVWNAFDAATTEPPYVRVSECEVRDATGRMIRMHVDTPRVLRALHSRGCRIAVASLNPDFERWSLCLSLFHRTLTHHNIKPLAS